MLVDIILYSDFNLLLATIEGNPLEVIHQDYNKLFVLLFPIIAGINTIAIITNNLMFITNAELFQI